MLKKLLIIGLVLCIAFIGFTGFMNNKNEVQEDVYTYNEYMNDLAQVIDNNMNEVYELMESGYFDCEYHEDCDCWYLREMGVA